MHRSAQRRHRRPRGALLAAALALPVSALLGATPATAATEYHPVPEKGYWEVQGRGHGHGRGLSQWGAQGAALQGLSHTQILDFYYPGTVRANIGDPTVRVLLTAPTSSRSVSFLPGPGASAPRVTTTDGRVLTGPVLTIRPEGTGLVAEVRDERGGAVRTSGRVAAGTSVPTDGGVYVTTTSMPNTAVWYRGSVSVQTTNGFEVVNTLKTSEYLYGVVPREIYSGWEPAALRAQAVAARTYARAVARPTSTQDICDTTACQVYGGRTTVTLPGFGVLHSEQETTTKAVQDTAGVILQRSATDRAPAFTQFSASSGGWTVGNPYHPYLAAVPDPYSGLAPGDTGSRWTDRLTVTELSTRCAPGGTARGMEITSRDGNGEWGGRITGLTVHCDNGTQTLRTEAAFRLGMRSSWWRPVTDASTFLLSDTLGSTAERTVVLGPPGTTDVMAGDWDGDGVTGLGHRVGTVLHLRQTPNSGDPQIVAPYGRAGDAVHVGDWDGNGTETVAVRRGTVFHVKNSIGPGVADLQIPYGRTTDEAFVGDWDGDGVATPGVRRGNLFLLKNSWSGGVADEQFAFGRAQDQIIVGDWDGSGIDRPVVRRGATFYVPTNFEGGVADRSVVFGRVTDRALAGDWNGDGVDTLGLHRLTP